MINDIVSLISNAEKIQKKLESVDVEQIVRAGELLEAFRSQEGRVRIVVSMSDAIEKASSINPRTLESIHAKRKDISSIASKLDAIEELFNLLDRQTIEKLLLLTQNLDPIISLALFLEDKKRIDALIETSKNTSSQIKEIQKASQELQSAKNDLETETEKANRTLSMMRTIASSMAKIKNEYEMLIQLLDKSKREVDAIKKLTVEAHESDKADAQFDPQKAILHLWLPRGPKEGKPGERGEPGKNFSPDKQGNLSERKQYDDAKKGFSFLALDTFPVMIYFKRSNKYGDWTDGQPIGFFSEDQIKKILEKANEHTDH